MLDSAIPAKFPVVWGASAGGAFIRTPPVASQIGIHDGFASFTDGYVPLNMTAVSAGGIPPFGQDQNGVLRAITQWDQWFQAGGPVYYDSAFSTAIGGYPKGASLMSSVTMGLVWVSTVDNNTTNPDSGGTNWTSVQALDHTWSGNNTFTRPVQITYSAGGQFIITGTGTGGAIIQLTGNGATAPTKYIRVANGQFQVLNSGFTVALLSLDDTGNLTMTGSSTFIDTAGHGITIDGSGNSVGGANLQLKGNGATTPSKFLRVQGGVFGIMNNAYTQAILTLSDAGAMTIPGSFAAGGAISAATGNVQASTGRLRALLGAFGTGDVAAGVILGDFAQNFGGSGFCRLPNGLIMQWGFVAGPLAANGASGATFLIAFSSLLSLTLTPANNNAITTSSWILTTSNTGFGFSTNAANVSSYYVAIGF